MSGSEGWLSIRRLIRNWISLSGILLALASIFAFLLLFVLDITSGHGNPYMGIVAYVVTPAFLFLGIGFVVLGVWLQYRQERRAVPGVPAISWSVDLKRPRDRKILVGFIAASVVFLLLTAIGSYQTYHYTESVQFCGQVCHVPMQPEHISYLHSPHARVDCVECHVGSGAEAYVKTKINGMRQLWHLARNDFPRPITMNSTTLRPARETCEHCHWPQKFSGSLDKTYRHFLSDEKNTPFSVRLLLNVGGGGGGMYHAAQGIHWHIDAANKVEYAYEDEQQQKIPWIRVTDAEGNAREFRDPEFKGDLKKLPVHTMDCIDCHNRPSHNLLPPDETIDRAMAAGRIDRSLRSVRSNIMNALTATYGTKDEALRKIEDSLRTAYPGHDPRVDAAIAEAKAIYGVNFFPEMKADWRAYPNNIGHKVWNGCFRCHDGKHVAEGGKQMKATDCNSCHLIIAQGSDADMAKLNPKGHDFIHIDAPYAELSCKDCHTGAAP